MEAYRQTIFRFLDATIDNAGLPLERREQAIYIKTSFAGHRNMYRLMAQVSALFNGGNLLHASHRVPRLDAPAQALVRRHGPAIQAIVTARRVNPTVADFEGHPIELVSILNPFFERALPGEKIFKLHQTLVAAERAANEHLARLTAHYGYHYIFRTGLNQYYLTKVVAAKVNFLRLDHRGEGNRMLAQRICYEVMDRRPNMTDAEKAHIIRALNCNADEVRRFWFWLAMNRGYYNAMKECIALMDNAQ
ncbi:hypothetical protein BJY04DRAFT_157094 [Aspergillus karnatakaensis]|uniref:putative mating locus protein n=1 Tax=Aspergillus karnatakaensis TaxID=1810916 RepID=UPI003CCD0101